MIQILAITVACIAIVKMDMWPLDLALGIVLMMVIGVSYAGRRSSGRYV